MIKETIVKMMWTPRNKTYYTDRGYLFTKYNEFFDVNISDLPSGSNAIVTKCCDFCYKESKIKWCLYLKQRNKNGLKIDCCKECSPNKHKMIMKDKYGVESPMHLNEVKNKVSNSLKIDFEYIKSEFSKNGYIVIDNEYIDAHTPINFICERHNHKDKITWNHFQRGECGCYYCHKENISGQNSHLWKGGISGIHNYLRKKIEPWKLDSMRECGFKCEITKGNFDVIHHLYSFTDIMNESLKEVNVPLYQDISKYTENELKQIEDKCLELHYKYGLGVCLTEELHKEFHSIYGQKNFTKENFEEFKNNKLKGEC